MKSRHNTEGIKRILATEYSKHQTRLLYYQSLNDDYSKQQVIEEIKFKELIEKMVKKFGIEL